MIPSWLMPKYRLTIPFFACRRSAPDEERDRCLPCRQSIARFFGGRGACAEREANAVLVPVGDVCAELRSEERGRSPFLTLTVSPAMGLTARSTRRRRQWQTPSGRCESRGATR